MKSLDYFTAIVLAKRSLDQEMGKEVVLWADLLLAQGADYLEVKNLICMDKNSSKAQTEKLVDDCFTKLGIKLISEKQAHLLFVWAQTQRLLKSEISRKDFLEQMCELCKKFDHEPVYMQFYLLHCAGNDLSKGASSIVFHDREVNENNFEQVLRWEVDLFLEQNEVEILELIKVRVRNE